MNFYSFVVNLVLVLRLIISRVLHGNLSGRVIKNLLNDESLIKKF